MKKSSLSALALLGLLAAAPAAADWLDTVARMLGISKTPSAQRAAGGAPSTGDVMVAQFTGGTPKALTAGGGYRSPVFLPDGRDLLALRGEDLVRIPLTGGAHANLRTLPGAVKLLGIDRSNPERVLLLMEGAGDSSVLAAAPLAGGAVETLPHNPDSKDDRRLMSHLRGENREYDGVYLYLKPESKETAGGTVEWTDVYAKVGDSPPVNLSSCDGAACVQPSLSPDGRQVAFIRAAK